MNRSSIVQAAACHWSEKGMMGKTSVQLISHCVWNAAMTISVTAMVVERKVHSIYFLYSLKLTDTYVHIWC